MEPSPPDTPAASPAVPESAFEPRPGPAAGNAQVAVALRELAAIGDRPLAEHPDAFARVHTGLQQALAGLDTA